MNTPETDNERTLKLALEVFTKLANTLKQERDEAREALAAEIKHHVETTVKWNGHHMLLTITQCDLNKALQRARRGNKSCR
jgi:DNA-binding protein H-NS